ncbi:MAG TPA: hypothetical protein VF585_09515 [Chthoniobacterales bacterium]|jgi:hypothetical protein
MDDEFKELQTLLRLKKYEQPPQGFEAYGERFLKEFHRRQRWEASRKTGLAAVWEKLSEMLEGFTVPRYAYATTLAVFGAIAFGVNGWQPTDAGSQLVAAAPQTATVVSASRPALALNSPLDLSDLEVQSQLTTGSQAGNTDAHPRYILDSRPASHDASFSF